MTNPTPKQLLCQNKALKQCFEEAEQKIKELEQQLAAKPSSKLDWSIIDPSIIFVTQHRRSGEIYFQGGHEFDSGDWQIIACLLYTSPSPRDRTRSRMPSSA